MCPSGTFFWYNYTNTIRQQPIGKQIRTFYDWRVSLNTKELLFISYGTIDYHIIPRSYDLHEIQC